MEFFAQLNEATASGKSYLHAAPIIAAAVAGEATRAQYIAFLTEAFHHVRHTVPLLMACGARLPGDQEWLRSAIAGYIEEEIGHQEWVLNDIAAAGGDAEAVRRGVPSLETELMVAYAYDTVTRCNPVGFFGMVYVLEGTSVQLATQVAGTLQRSLGLPASAFSYLASHGLLDLEHIDHLRQIVNRLELEADRAAVVHHAQVFFRLYGDVIRSVRCGAAS